MLSPKIEIEAKFIIPNTTILAELQGITHLGDFELKPSGGQSVFDRYLDTADRRLYGANYACRLRTGQGKQLLTLKSLLPAEGHIHRRPEIEVEVEGDQPQAWVAGEVKDLVLGIVGQEPLQTLFTLSQMRHKSHVFYQEQPVIEFSLDEVSWQDTPQVDYLELEAELIETGSEADLTRFVTALQSRWPLKAETKSKFEHAWNRLSQTENKTENETLPIPVSKKIGLTPSDTLAEAGRKIMAFHWARLLKYEAHARLIENGEAIHDMRIAGRRLATAFDIFEREFPKKIIKSLRQGLKATRRALGRVRDLDVLIANLQHYQQSLPEREQAETQVLIDTWLAKREQAQQKLLAYLDSHKYLQLKQKFLKFISTPTRDTPRMPPEILMPAEVQYLVPVLIYTQYEAVHAYQKLLPNASTETLHQLRIALKKFRYTIEYFQELLGPEKEMAIDAVKILQDHLGNLNDAEVTGLLLRDFLTREEKASLHLPPAAQQNLSPLVAYLHLKLNERDNLIDTFPQVWAHFNSSEFRRNLALSIAGL